MYRPAFDRVAGPAAGQAEVRQGSLTDRWSIYLPAVFLVFLDLWWKFLPLHPGCALAGFGFAVMVLLIRADVSRLWEKGLWVFFALSLLAVEIHAAHQARLDTNSFLAVRLLAPGQSIVDAHGTRSIRSAVMNVMDFDQFTALQDGHVGDAAQYERIMQTVPVGDFSPGTRKVFSLRPLASQGEIAHYRIIFSTPEGLWWENLQATSIDGHLFQAAQIVRYRSMKTNIVAEYEDAGYPHGASGVVDWGWAAREP